MTIISASKGGQDQIAKEHKAKNGILKKVQANPKDDDRPPCSHAPTS
jgi:hypothetical protein